MTENATEALIEAKDYLTTSVNVGFRILIKAPKNKSLYATLLDTKLKNRTFDMVSNCQEAICKISSLVDKINKKEISEGSSLCSEVRHCYEALMPK